MPGFGDGFLLAMMHRPQGKLLILLIPEIGTANEVDFFPSCLIACSLLILYYRVNPSSFKLEPILSKCMLISPCIIFLYQILVSSVPKYSFEIQSRIKTVSSKVVSFCVFYVVYKS